MIASTTHGKNSVKVVAIGIASLPHFMLACGSGDGGRLKIAIFKL
jgi:hypothetical protein